MKLKITKKEQEKKLNLEVKKQMISKRLFLKY